MTFYDMAHDNYGYSDFDANSVENMPESGWMIHDSLPGWTPEPTPARVKALWESVVDGTAEADPAFPLLPLDDGVNGGDR